MALLLVLSGPSGAGKGTVARRLVEREPTLWLSVSATTRPPRSSERPGEDYLFVDREGFERLGEDRGFLERFEVFGHLYGTPRRPVEDRLAEGHDVLLEIDVQGAMAVRSSFPEAVLVFLAPPSRAVQRDRLTSRGGMPAEQLERRLAAAEEEEALAKLFDHVVVNDELEGAVTQVAGILAASRGRGR